MKKKRSESKTHHQASGIQHPASIDSHLSTSEALAKIQRYCAYQERSHQEVRTRLFSYGLHTTEVDELIARLITDKFLNEERFAKAFAGGKFRMKKWGKLKIVHELESHGLTDRCITSGLREIDAFEYQKTLLAILKKKIHEVTAPNLYAKRNKVARHAIAKGYEPELVWDLLKEMLP